MVRGGVGSLKRMVVLGSYACWEGSLGADDGGEDLLIWMQGIPTYLCFKSKVQG